MPPTAHPQLGVNWDTFFKHHPVPYGGPPLRLLKADPETGRLPSQYRHTLLSPSSLGDGQRSVEEGVCYADAKLVFNAQRTRFWLLQMYARARRVYLVADLGVMAPQASHLLDINAFGGDDYNTHAYFQTAGIYTLLHVASHPEMCWAAPDPPKPDKDRGVGEEEQQEVQVMPFDAPLREAAQRCTGSRESFTFKWRDDTGGWHDHSRGEVKLFQLDVPRRGGGGRDTAIAYVLELTLFDARLCLGRGLQRLIAENRKGVPKRAAQVLSSGGSVDMRTGEPLARGASSPLDVWRQEPPSRVKSVDLLHVWFEELSGNPHAYRRQRSTALSMGGAREWFGASGNMDLTEVFSAKRLFTADGTVDTEYDFALNNPEVRNLDENSVVANLKFLQHQENLQALIRPVPIVEGTDAVEVPMEEAAEEPDWAREEEEGEGEVVEEGVDRLPVFPDPEMVFRVPLLHNPRYVCTAIFPHVAIQEVGNEHAWKPEYAFGLMPTVEMPFPRYSYASGTLFTGHVQDVIEYGVRLDLSRDLEDLTETVRTTYFDAAKQGLDRDLFTPRYGRRLAEAQQMARHAWLRGWDSTNVRHSPAVRNIIRAMEKEIQEGDKRYTVAERECEEGEKPPQTLRFSLFPKWVQDEMHLVGLGPAGELYNYILQKLEAPPFSIAQHHAPILLALLISHEVYQEEFGLQPFMILMGEASTGKSNVLDFLRSILIQGSHEDVGEKSEKADFGDSLNEHRVILMDEVAKGTGFFKDKDDKHGGTRAKMQLSRGTAPYGRLRKNDQGDFTADSKQYPCRGAILGCSNDRNLAEPIRSRCIEQFIERTTRKYHDVASKIARGHLTKVCGASNDSDKLKPLLQRRQMFHCLVGGLYQCGGLYVDTSVNYIVNLRFMRHCDDVLGHRSVKFEGRLSDRIRKLSQVIATDRAFVMLCCGAGAEWGVEPDQPYGHEMWENHLELASLLRVTEEDVLLALSFLTDGIRDSAAEVVATRIVKLAEEWKTKFGTYGQARWNKEDAVPLCEDGKHDFKEAEQSLLRKLAADVLMSNQSMSEERYRDHLYSLKKQRVLSVRKKPDSSFFELVVDKKWVENEQKTQRQRKKSSPVDGLFVGSVVYEALRRTALAQFRRDGNKRVVGLFGMPLLTPANSNTPMLPFLAHAVPCGAGGKPYLWELNGRRPVELQDSPDDTIGFTGFCNYVARLSGAKTEVFGHHNGKSYKDVAYPGDEEWQRLRQKVVEMVRRLWDDYHRFRGQFDKEEEVYPTKLAREFIKKEMASRAEEEKPQDEAEEAAQRLKEIEELERELKEEKEELKKLVQRGVKRKRGEEEEEKREEEKEEEESVATWAGVFADDFEYRDNPQVSDGLRGDVGDAMQNRKKARQEKDKEAEETKTGRQGQVLNFFETEAVGEDGEEEEEEEEEEDEDDRQFIVDGEEEEESDRELLVGEDDEGGGGGGQVEIDEEEEEEELA